jgi:hypothetical protein
MIISTKHLLLLGAVSILGTAPAFAQDASTEIGDGGVVTAPGTPDAAPVPKVGEQIRNAVQEVKTEIKAWHDANPGQPLPLELKEKLEKAEQHHDKMHDVRENREDRRDVIEDKHDAREDVRDAREDVRDAKHDGGKRDVIEDKRDAREDIRDAKEDRHDKMEDVRDDRRDGRYDRRDGRQDKR